MKSFIEINEFAIERDTAAKIVDAALLAIGIPSAARGQSLSVPNVGIPQDITVETLVSETRRNGVVPYIHNLLARTERPGAIPLATNSRSLTISVECGPDTRVSVSGPGYVTSDTITDALEDILHYRRIVAELSAGEDSFRPCFRAFKAYLSACVTAVDGTMNRLRFYEVANGNGRLTHEQRKTLDNIRSGIESKMRKWIPIFSGGSSLSESQPYWVAFAAIREARNAFTHVNSPTYKFDVRSAADQLNLCRTGVGGLLVAIHHCIGHSHPDPAVLSVLHAPEARFVDQ